MPECGIGELTAEVLPAPGVVPSVAYDVGIGADGHPTSHKTRQSVDIFEAAADALRRQSVKTVLLEILQCKEGGGGIMGLACACQSAVYVAEGGGSVADCI